MAAGLGLSNGPGTGVGTRGTGDSAPRCTDSIGFLLAALSGGAGPFTPA